MKLIRRKLHDVEIALKPLSVEQMLDVFSIMSTNVNDIAANMKAGILAIKYSLKEIKGLKDYNGDEIVLQFKDDILEDETMNLLVNSNLSQPLIAVASALVQGAPTVDLVEGVKRLGKSKK